MGDTKENEDNNASAPEDGNSWWGGWPVWLQSAKEKSSTALEFMKRDLSELSQVVQTDAVAAVSSTAAMLKEKLTVDSVETVAIKARDSVSSFLEVLTDVFVPMKEIEDGETTEAFVIKNSEPVILGWWQMTETGENSKNAVSTQKYDFGPWAIFVRKSHILQSRCNTPENCQAVDLSNAQMLNTLCNFCRFEKGLQLPQLPEMTFPNNVLRIQHEKGFGITFNCFDALKCVDSKRDPMKVAVSEAWKEARAENAHIKDVVKPFDWTFSTDYMGTISQFGSLKISNTEDRIDIEKLKVKEKILFYEDMVLYEDELADNGVAQCSVKIRVMQDSFFILLRYFLRVDNMCVKVNETRIYHELNKSYILREFTHKAALIRNLEVPPSVLSNPAELCNHVPVVKSFYQKVEFPV